MSIKINENVPYFEGEYGDEYMCPNCNFDLIKSRWSYCPNCGQEIEWVDNSDDENDTSNRST